MSVRDVKNQAFDALTPEAMRPLLYSHGRELANAESTARIILAPYLFYTAATGKKGFVPAAVRVAKMISDGHDGFMAEQAHDFKTAKPDVFSVGGLAKAVVHETRARKSLRGKFDGVVEALHRTDGKALDQLADKWAQVADQLGASVHGDLTWHYTGLTVARNAWINRGVRPTYRELGVEGASGATAVSQIKTVIDDGARAIEAAGLFEHAPQVRKVAEVVGATLTMYSAADIMIQNETAYLNQIGADVAAIHPLERLITSTSRTVTYLSGGDPARAGVQILPPGDGAISPGQAPGEAFPIAV